MPTILPKISDVVAELGLRDLFPPQKRVYIKACPEIQHLSDYARDSVARNYSHWEPNRIKESQEIFNHASKALELFGQAIWGGAPGDPDKRPWLFRPGQSSPGGLYQKNLYYSHDQEILRNLLHRFLVAKTLHYRKKHGPDPLQTPQSSSLATPIAFTSRLDAKRFREGSESCPLLVKRARTGPNIPPTATPVPQTPRSQSWEDLRYTPSSDRDDNDSNIRVSGLGPSNQTQHLLEQFDDVTNTTAAMHKPSGGLIRETYVPLEVRGRLPSDHTTFGRALSPASSADPSRSETTLASLSVDRTPAGYPSLLEASKPAFGRLPSPGLSVPPIDAMPFKIWFTFPGPLGTARMVFRLDSSMNFERAFALLHRKLEGHLRNGGLQDGIYLQFEGEENSYLVSEEDTWNEVLEQIKVTGKTDLMAVLRNSG